MNADGRSAISTFFLNKETSEVKKLGINHFEEHVGIPPHLVKEIIRGALCGVDWDDGGNEEFYRKFLGFK